MTSTPGARSERLLFDPMQAILQRPDQNLGQQRNSITALTAARHANRATALTAVQQH